MSDRGDTREQPSNRDPGALRAEHIFLIVAAVSLSAAVAAYILDATLPIELNRGAYAIMVAFFVAGYCGWLSRSAERRMRRVAVDELQRLATAVEELRDQVERQRITYLPAPHRSSEGQRYIGAVAVGAEDDAAQTVGIDPASIAAARRISNRLRAVDTE